MFPSTWLFVNKSCRLNFSTSGSSGIGDGGNVNLAGQPLTRSTSESSASHPAAKRSLETGTVSFEFLPGGR